MNIKINSGFFKTVNYSLSKKKDKLTLSSLGYEDIDLLRDNIKEIKLIIKNLDLIEIEILTGEKNYIGIINEKANVEKTIEYFKDGFTDKLKVEIN